MLKYLKEFYWRRVRAYSNGDVHLTEQFIRGSKPFDVVDNASNLIGNFMEAGRSDAAKAIFAEMVGTTRSRVSMFMNKFRKLGFIKYNGSLEVHNSLLNVVLHDSPHLRKRAEKEK